MSAEFKRVPYHQAKWGDLVEVEKKLPGFLMEALRPDDLRRKILVKAALGKLDRADLRCKWELHMDLEEATFLYWRKLQAAFEAMS